VNATPFGRRSWLAALAFALLPVACSTPEPPKITPRAVKLVAISSTGIEVDVTLSAENPNGIDLEPRTVDATMTFDGGLEIGKAQITKGLRLPARKTVDLSVPLSLRWQNLAALAPYALRETVPYTVSGQVQFGKPISVGVPFTIKGTLTRADLTKLALSAIPGIPGLPALQ
jgi:LEA14-like dessication related protein